MIFRTFICGALAGLNAITLTFPLDVARTRLAINTTNSHIKENNIFQSLQFLYKTEGFKGLFRGYSICFVVYQINLGIYSVCGCQTNML
jgi:solute carrier family 25 thiamine pyrophosphate transporter 19